jgi:hypothetical protein
MSASWAVGVAIAIITRMGPSASERLGMMKLASLITAGVASIETSQTSLQIPQN